jgi:hypothetical protein
LRSEQGQAFDVTLLIKDVLDEFNRLDTLTISSIAKWWLRNKTVELTVINARSLLLD